MSRTSSQTAGSVSLRDRLRTLTFICPKCSTTLTQSDTDIRCMSCGETYPVVDGAIDFLRRPPPIPPVDPATGSPLRRWIATLPPDPARWNVEIPSSINNDHGVLRKFLAAFPAEASILDLGSGPRRLDARIVTSDLDRWPEVDCAADAHHLPFAHRSFDGVVLQEVIEHVTDPSQVLSETARVLREGGLAYVEAPFLFPEHAEADFRRWTRAGLELEVSKHLQVIEAGTVMGPSAALSVTWRAFLELRMQRSHWALRNLAAWATSGIRNLDRRSSASRLYAASYVIGKAVVSERPEAARV